MKDDLRPRGSTRVNVTLGTATVLCGSDAHYDPRVSPSAAHRAFVHFCTELGPQLVILNGDVIDGASISRFPAIGWESGHSASRWSDFQGRGGWAVGGGLGRNCSRGLIGGRGKPIRTTRSARPVPRNVNLLPQAQLAYRRDGRARKSVAP
jgi:hypothetical protein